MEDNNFKTNNNDDKAQKLLAAYVKLGQEYQELARDAQDLHRKMQSYLDKQKIKKVLENIINNNH